MDSRERLLTVLNNQTPDRLPCQVHGWMNYYLKTYLGGRDQFEAYEYFPGMDWVVYVNPKFSYTSLTQKNWDVKRSYGTRDEIGNITWKEMITTPAGELTLEGGSNAITEWYTKHIIESEADFEIWRKYYPQPNRVDWTPVIDAQERIGNKGIVRGEYFGYGQGSPWQDFCRLVGTEEAILLTFDKPDWVHEVMATLLKLKVGVIEKGGVFQQDLVEMGGGAGSSTVISPTLHENFCLPYDKVQIKAVQNAGAKVVYHLCGGMMPLLDVVVQNGANGLETMTPPAMGGDCDLAEAHRRIGSKMFFVGGFDQNAGFEQGTPERARELVEACHQARPDGGYICSPSDHFFKGDPANVQAFVDACVASKYGG